MYNNRQSAADELSNEQIQVLLTGKFGDGGLYSRYNKGNLNCNFYYATNCIHKDYLEYKKKLLGNLCSTEIKESINNGYKIGTIYKLATKTSSKITEIALESIESSLYKLNELGLALWVYDDGSLHNKKNFYNINTQSYSKEVQQDLFIPFLKDKFSINSKLTKEIKKDSREFYYLRIGKYDGAFIITEILKKYYVPCFNYKLISSETIQRWSKLQEELKSVDIDMNNLTNYQIGQLFKNISI